MVFGKHVTIANTNAFSGGIWAIEYKFKLNNSYLFKNKGGNDPTKFSNKVCRAHRNITYGCRKEFSSPNVNDCKVG